MNQNTHDNKANGLHVYRRLLKYAYPYWKVLLVAAFAMIAGSLIEASFAYLMKLIMEEGIVNPNPELALFFSLAIIAIFIFRGVSSYLANYCIAFTGGHIVAKMRHKMFHHLLALPSSFYDHSSTGDLISRITYNTTQVADAASKSILVIISDSARVIFQLSLMFYLNFYLSLGFLILAPLIMLIVLYINKRLRRINRNMQRSMGTITSIAEEIINGYQVVKIFGGQQYEKSRYQKAVEYHRAQKMKLVVTEQLSVPFVQLIVALAVSAAIFLSISGYVPTPISAGDLTAYMISMTILLPSIRRLTTVNGSLQRGIAAGQDIFGFLDREPEVDNGKESLKEPTVNIEYKDVRFRYVDKESDALRGISLKIKPKTVAAFVGKSGSGKTTLVNLIPGLYVPTAGCIRLNGDDIKDIALHSLRNNISYVGQDTVLFNDSIMNNIAYGSVKKSDTEAVIRAAKHAHAWEFIEKLPQGLDTRIGEDGVLLSGGQRQRLAMARAFLKNAPILILDEATSSLDSESEKHIQAAMATLMQGRTTLIIAHRLSTIEMADVIFVMENGQIIESGNHHELLAAGKKYKHMHSMQFS